MYVRVGQDFWLLHEVYACVAHVVFLSVSPDVSSGGVGGWRIHDIITLCYDTLYCGIQ